MSGTTNLLTERQPAPITIELWTLADLGAFKLLMAEGLYGLDKHDDTFREAIMEACEETHVKNVEGVADAYYEFIDRMRRFVDGKETETDVVARQMS